MTGRAARYLYLTRHGEASPDESELKDAGRHQAALLGERLRGIPLAAIHDGPLARAEQTAQLVDERLDGVPRRRSEAQATTSPNCRPARSCRLMTDGTASLGAHRRRPGFLDFLDRPAHA